MHDPLSTLTWGSQYMAACTADVDAATHRVTGWRYGCYTFAADDTLQRASAELVYDAAYDRWPMEQVQAWSSVQMWAAEQVRSTTLAYVA